MSTAQALQAAEQRAHSAVQRADAASLRVAHTERVLRRLAAVVRAAATRRANGNGNDDDNNNNGGEQDDVDAVASDAEQCVERLVRALRAETRARLAADEAARQSAASAAAAQARAHDATARELERGERVRVEASSVASSTAAAAGDSESGEALAETRVSAALERVEQLAANNRVLILELETQRALTSSVARKWSAMRRRHDALVAARDEIPR